MGIETLDFLSLYLVEEVKLEIHWLKILGNYVIDSVTMAPIGSVGPV